ncbi:cell envelope integrity protein TolA [Pseudomonas sp. Sample_22]|uniref:cell envelope integrity protein TolA n=1 Tax=Pseudomonas sp. Sample_22 TaxID=2448266 RepID=UPI001032CF34|nr:cell envelope integrity protein TolA [Pseudomonas sp. Sample_22]
MKLQYLIIPLMCLALAACRDPDPKSVSLPTNNNSVLDVVDAYQAKRAIQALSETDRTLLQTYLVRTAMDYALGEHKGKPINIGEAIIAQQAWLDEQNAKAAKQQAIKNEEEAAKQQAIRDAEVAQQQAIKDNEAKQQALLEEISKQKTEALDTMNAALTANLVSFKLEKKNYKKKIYSDYIDIELVIKNNSESELSGFKGTLVIKDMMGNPVKALEISASLEVEPGQAVLYATKFDHNSLLEEDKLLATLDLEKVHYEWIPGVYTFKSGETLKMPT